MGKVYFFETLKLRRQLRELQQILADRIKYCEKNGYIWLDHYTIKDLHEQIKDIKAQLGDDYEEFA